MFFSSWGTIGRIVLISVLVYLGLVLALRVAGARALAKMSGYDLVVTIALGSLIATIPLQTSITVSDGFAAILTFLALQWSVSWALERWRITRLVIKDRPEVVIYEGVLLRDRMRRIQVTEDEVLAAIRSAGKASVEQVLALVLENDGNWSVIPRGDAPDRSSLAKLDLPVSHPEREIHRPVDGGDGTGDGRGERRGGGNGNSGTGSDGGTKSDQTTSQHPL